MGKAKRLIAMLTGAIFLCTGTTVYGSNSDEDSNVGSREITVAFCQTGVQNSWRLAETNSIKDEAEARGWKLIYTDANEDTAQQIADMEDAIAQKPDAILLAPRETEGYSGVLEKAKDDGIPVILIDRSCAGEAGEDYTTLISADFYWEGQQAALTLVDKFGTERDVNVVQITGTPDASSTIERQQGFEEELAKYPNFKIIATQNGEYVRSTAQSVMENVVQAHGEEIDAVFGHDDECAIGAMQALKLAGIEVGGDDGVSIVGIGGFKDAATSISNDEMLATVLCSPFFGPVAFDVVEEILDGETVDTFIQNEGYVITKGNVEEYLPKSF